MSLLELSASELAAATRAGLLTPIEVVEAYIGRIVAVNPAINALDRLQRAWHAGGGAAGRRAGRRGAAAGGRDGLATGADAALDGAGAPTRATGALR
jgi:aspartyl-tRNA(Asn)/glutamyl-tRNA(Gln) amidotransferase subunit A